MSACELGVWGILYWLREGASCWLCGSDNSLMIRRWLREGASYWLCEGDNS